MRVVIYICAPPFIRIFVGGIACRFFIFTLSLTLMKFFHNSTFLRSDINRTSNHKARFKKHNRRKFFSADERLFTKTLLLFHWNRENVRGWADAYHTLNSPRLSKVKTIKRSCLYSDRVRSVNTYLGLSKYKIADFSRRGLIKDLKKY